MSLKNLVNSSTSRCRPILYAVPESEIVVATNVFDVHADLVSAWREIGYGFFQSDQNGARLTTFTNRLVGPTELPEIAEIAASLDENPFAWGTPVFETADSYYMSITKHGSIMHSSGVVIADSLEQFLLSLVDDPEFWLEKLS